MHEHDEKCLNTSSNCHKGPTQMHKHQMGLSPIKKIEKNFTKSKNPTQFSKILNFKTLSTDST